MSWINKCAKTQMNKKLNSDATNLAYTHTHNKLITTLKCIYTQISLQTYLHSYIGMVYIKKRKKHMYNETKKLILS